MDKLKMGRESSVKLDEEVAKTDKSKLNVFSGKAVLINGKAFDPATMKDKIKD